MASLGHIAVGLSLGRLWRPSRHLAPFAAFSALAMLPDSDVIAFALHIPYSAPFGHRGAAHSLIAAAIVGKSSGDEWQSVCCDL